MLFLDMLGGFYPLVPYGSLHSELVPSLENLGNLVSADTPCWPGTFASVLPTRTKRSSRACRCALRVGQTLPQEKQKNTSVAICCLSSTLGKTLSSLRTIEWM
jgi:hypothetical protein